MSRTKRQRWEEKDREQKAYWTPIVLGHCGGRLPEGERSLAQFLRDTGYNNFIHG